jgi:hypothetical protein
MRNLDRPLNPVTWEEEGLAVIRAGLDLAEVEPEVVNVTLKCNGVTPYSLSHESRAITFRSDNSSNFDKVITLGCDNNSNELEVITFLHRAKALCDNTKCKVMFSI